MSAAGEDSGAAESRQLNFNEYDDDYYADNGGGVGGDYYDDRQGAGRVQQRQQKMRQRKQLAQRRTLLARRQLAVQKDRTTTLYSPLLNCQNVLTTSIDFLPLI